MRQAKNNVRIEGILSEVDLKDGSYVKNGQTIENINGSIKILVEQNRDGKTEELVIPVYMFAAKYKKDGGINPAYESIKNIQTNYVSIAAAGEKDSADRVRITNGSLMMNEFPGQNGEIVSQLRVTASFVTKVTKNFNPEANFSLEFVVNQCHRCVDSEGVELEPAKLEIDVIVPQYTAPNAEPNVDCMKLYAVSPNVISAIEEYWEPQGTYSANGRLNFMSDTITVSTKVDFGTPREESRTISINELIVTGGTQSPLDNGMEFDADDIRKGLKARAVKIEAKKAGKGTGKKAPAPTTKVGFNDLGF